MGDQSAQALSALIGAIYDCALEPSRWDETLAWIADEMACAKAILSLNALHDDRILIKKTFGWESRWLEERDRHLAEIHSGLAPWLEQQPSLDRPFVASREIPAEYFAVSPYAQTCLRPQGIVDVAHYFLISTPARYSELALFRAQAHGVMTEGAIELGMLLLPHIRRAVTISNVLEARTIERDRMAGALDALRQGVLLTDERGGVLHANRAAERLLEDGDALEVARGVLHARTRAADAELSRAIAMASQDESRLGDEGRTVRLSDPEAAPVFAHVLPMRGGRLRAGMGTGATAAVFVNDAGEGPGGADALAAACGLTQSERRVLASLAAGRTLFETASDLGIARTTARSHLSSIFAKTGVSRQADLMRLVMQAAPPSAP